MGKLLVVAILLLVAIAGVGFYQGWFHLSTDSTDRKPSATITIDQDKIKADEEKAKEKLHDLGQKVKQRTGDPKVPDPKGP
jgi:hypothetical protein